MKFNKCKINRYLNVISSKCESSGMVTHHARVESSHAHIAQETMTRNHTQSKTITDNTDVSTATETQITRAKLSHITAPAPTSAKSSNITYIKDNQITVSSTQILIFDEPPDNNIYYFNLPQNHSTIIKFVQIKLNNSKKANEQLLLYMTKNKIDIAIVQDHHHSEKTQILRATNRKLLLQLHK